MPPELIPFAFASGSPNTFRVVKVWLGLRTKFVNNVGVVALSELNPAIVPALLIALAVVPPPLFPGPLKVTKLL